MADVLCRSGAAAALMGMKARDRSIRQPGQNAFCRLWPEDNMQVAELPTPDQLISIFFDAQVKQEFPQAVVPDDAKSLSLRHTACAQSNLRKWVLIPRSTACYIVDDARNYSPDCMTTKIKLDC